MILSRRTTLAGLASLPLLSAPNLLAARSTFKDNHPVDFGRGGPATFPVHGIDAARFQGPIDWRRVKRAGVQFAWLKATEGGDLLDPEFKRNWRGARRAGIPVGAYHFYYFCTDAETQARWFIRNAPKVRGGLPPVIDLEWNPFSPTCVLRPPAATVRAEALKFIRIVERHYGTRPVIYTAPDFWETNAVSRLGGDFWLRSTANHVNKRYRFKGWTFWQYTATGVVDGVGKEVDLNCFNGTQGQWNRWRKARAVR